MLTEIVGKHRQPQTGYLMTDSAGRLHVYIALVQILAEIGRINERYAQGSILTS